jgi:hypothetical protein
MENNKNLDEFLRKQMSSDNLDLKDPNLSLVNEARKKVMNRKNVAKTNGNLFSFLTTLFNLEIKLYQGGLASVLIALGVFYFTDKPSKTENNYVAEYSSNKDTSRSYSVKATMFLVKNFSSQIN